MKKTQKEIAMMLGVMPSTVNKWIKRFEVSPCGKNGQGRSVYNTDAEPIAGWFLKAGIHTTENSAEDVQEEPATAEQQYLPHVNMLPENVSNMPLFTRELTHTLGNGAVPAVVLLNEALKQAQRDRDSYMLARLAQMSIKEEREAYIADKRAKREEAITIHAQARADAEHERAVALKIENDLRHGELIERSVIKNLFANLNQILAGLTRLGAKYAGTICELTNYDNQIEIQTLLETECYKVLADIQKEIKDWITAEEL